MPALITSPSRRSCSERMRSARSRGFERGEVGQVVTQLLVACLFTYSVQGGPKAFHVPAVQQHRSALRRELLRDAPAQAVGGARYKYGRFCRLSYGYSFLSMTSQFP